MRAATARLTTFADGPIRRLLVALSVLLLGAAPPEVVRLRVPSDQVSKWFPPGTPLQGFSAEEFDALVSAARAGLNRRVQAAPPRLLRARHFARWEAGVLLGRTELIVDPALSGHSELVLAPWTPAIELDEGGPSFRSSPDGATTILVNSSSQATLSFPWQLRARPASRGVGFSLGLPTCDASRLELELPEGVVPEGFPGVRQGPLSSSPGKHRWVLEGRGGSFDLQLRDPGRDKSSGERQLWVEGPTRIDLLESSANWRLDWRLSAGAAFARQLTLELDPGVDLIDVTGPAVELFRAEPLKTGTKVTVTLADSWKGTTSLTVRGLAELPKRGAWAIPAARPVDAVWTGGLTTVHLDAGRVVQDCRERAGRLLPSPDGEVGGPIVLAFEAHAPRSVAELVLRRPRAEVSALVRGQLRVGNSAPRLESWVTYRLDRGRLLDLQVDLPALWVPDRVEIAGQTEPAAWHPEVLPDGAVRIHVRPPSGDWSSGPVVLVLAATATVSGGRGPMALPRIRPVGTRVADELWSAWTGPGITLEPTSTRGLAWLDPARAEAPSPPDPSSWRQALAWRWVSENGEARVDRGRIELEPSSKVHLLASVERERLRLDWRISVHSSGELLKTVPVYVNEPLDSLPQWSLTDEATGLPVESQPMHPDRRWSLGLPRDGGTAFELVLPGPGRRSMSLRSQHEVRWDGKGRLPLVSLPGRFHSEGLVSVLVAKDMLSTVETSDLRTLPPGMTAKLSAREHATGLVDVAEKEWGSLRMAHAFSYSEPTGTLELRTQRLESTPLPGVIREVVLTTLVNARGQDRQHLVCRIAADRARSLEFSLPEGATLLQAWREGQACTPIRTGSGLSIPLIGPRQSKTLATIALDYLTRRPSPSGPATVKPVCPAFALPCLSFCWQVAVPDHWGVVEHGPALLPADPATRRTWESELRGLLGLPFSGGSSAKAREGLAGEMRRALDERVAATFVAETTLGEWLARLDALSSTIVVDRMALAASGWGPKSRLVFPQRPQKTAANRSSAFEEVGLAALPVGSYLLVTTREVASHEAGKIAESLSWETMLRECAAWGADRSERFQCVARWRGEVTPRNPLGEWQEPVLTSPGWTTWRYVASGIPEHGAELQLIDQQAQAAWGWAAGLLVIAGSITLRRWPMRWRGIYLALAAFVAPASATIGPARFASLGMGGFLAALLVFFFWIGRSLAVLRRPQPRSLGSAPAPFIATASSTFTPMLVAGLLLAGAVAGLAQANSRLIDTTPILALLPFDGPPDPLRPAERVLVRLADSERLRTWAADDDPANSTRGPRVISAAHSVTRRDDLQAHVESEIELQSEDRGETEWPVPIENAREIAATLDGKPVPLFVRPGGATAVVRLTKPGRSRLRLERLVTLGQQPTGTTLRLPINPVAISRVSVKRDNRSQSIEIPTARGRVDAGEGRLTALLGPTDRLEIRWNSRPDDSPETRGGAVEGLLLWDAEPAGDRLRARLSYFNSNGTSRIRLRLEPGLMLRSATVPGLVDTSRQERNGFAEWVAAVDPPLPDGATVDLEFWKSREDTEGAGEKTPERPVPFLEPLGVERYSGALGFRRPSDWTGRLPAIPGTDPMTEEAFVKAWRRLPDEPLTLSGATRFVRPPVVAPHVAPTPTVVKVKPAVDVVLDSGRVQVAIDAELVELNGRVRQLKVELPGDFQVDRVAADDLTEWSRDPSGLLRVRFDGAPTTRQRHVRIGGWKPLRTDALATVAVNQELRVPWPRWAEVVEEPGVLKVEGPLPFSLDIPGQPSPLPAEASNHGAAPRLFRLTRRVEESAAGTIRWTDETSRVGVLVESQLTLSPERADWVAIVRYDVSKGPYGTIHLKLPQAWARGAEVAWIGGSRQLTAETRNKTTYWTIRPERPIWASGRVVIRSSLSRDKRAPIDFPDLVPLGQGVADTYLALVNATGADLSVEGSAGLQPIEASRFDREEFGSALPGIRVKTYHVLREGWKLQCQPTGESTADAPNELAPRITLADLSGNLSSRGAMVGMARYEVERSSGAFLPLALPASAGLLFVSVNDEPVTPQRVPGSGRWLVPIDASATNDVVLVWQTPPEAQNSKGGRLVLPSPVTVRGPTRTLLTLASPATLLVGHDDRVFSPVSNGRIETERVERLGQRIANRLSELDRDSRREREALFASLLRFELGVRSADRAIVAAIDEPSDADGTRLRAMRERLRVARSRLDDSLRNAGLEEYDHAARSELGLTSTPGALADLKTSEAVSAMRLHRQGRPTFFVANAKGDRPLALAVEPVSTARGGSVSRIALLLLSAPAVCALVWLVTRRADSATWPRWAVWCVLVLTVGLVDYRLGFLPAALAFGTAMLGWASRLPRVRAI